MSSEETEGSASDEALPSEAGPETGPETEIEAGADRMGDLPEANASPEADDDDDDDSFRARPEADLAQTLLHQPVVHGTSTDRRWIYPVWLQLLVSLFIAYHATILLVHNLPGKGLAKGLQKKLDQELKLEWPLSKSQFGLHASHYWRATGNTQSWAMFAPNPHRSNIFMKVLVKDADGEVWDLKHDIYGKRTYPYLWYDRMGKINRRIIDQKGYRRHYAAWVCREWERTHGGEPADEVQFVKMWTRIPPPQAVLKRAEGNPFRLGYDPMELELHEREEDTIRCKTTRQAQLPPYLRERYGLPPAPENHFLELHMRTWWDQKESQQAQRDRDSRSERQRERRRSMRGRARGGAR